MVHEHDDGQAALPLVVALTCMLVVALLAIGRVGGAVTDRARARTAADAAALAGAHDGEPGARALAARNDATLVEFVRVGDEVEVTVVVDEVRASARAQLAGDTG